MTLKSLRSLGELMQRDWDRRMDCDYLLWTSEETESAEAMWRSGERDFDLLMKGATQPDGVALEIGCGVGRLLRPALLGFGKVIGLDVSSQALGKAREFLADKNCDLSRLELIQGDGVSFGEIADNSIDVVFSFAAISSVPTRVVGQYLVEIIRVLKKGGKVRLQVYLGRDFPASEEDTLHLRAYEEKAFRKAAEYCGLRVEYIDELRLPFECSPKDLGITASLVGLEKVGEWRETLSGESCARLLSEYGDYVERAEDSGLLESVMSLNRGKKLIEKGEFSQARRVLEYALEVSGSNSSEVLSLIKQIAGKVSEEDGEPDCYTRNMAVLGRRFPQLTSVIESAKSDAEVDWVNTAEGPVFRINGESLDHPSSPLRGGRSWVRQQGYQGEDVAVFGFGGGYHVAALIEESKGKVAVLEPSVTLFRQVLTQRDITKTLERIDELLVGGDVSNWSPSSSTSLMTRAQSKRLFIDEYSQVQSRVIGVRGLSELRPRIGVLGPLMGGTLPILDYVDSAFRGMGQSSRSINLAGFSEGYTKVEGFIRQEFRRGVAQSSYVKFLSDLVHQHLQERPVDVLVSMALAPVSPELLKQLREQGVITVLWFVEDFRRFSYWQDCIGCYDYVFTIQRGECIEAMQSRLGTASVHYLPCGADPEVHKPVELTTAEKERFGSPVSFVGAGYHNRQQMFAYLRHYPFKIWGTEWPNSRPFLQLVQEGGRRLTPDEYVKIFNASEINLNLHSSTERDGVEPGGDFINPRTFEIAATGGFQLVDVRQYIPECFEIDRDIVVFNSLEDLRRKIDYFLEHPHERREIAERARERVLREHTYQKRMETMLEIIFRDKFNSLKKTQDDSPWNRMLKRVQHDKELESRCLQVKELGMEPTLDHMMYTITSAEGDLSYVEQKLLFLFHIKRQMIMKRTEEIASTGRKL